jgi:hypothetical protein
LIRKVAGKLEEKVKETFIEQGNRAVSSNCFPVNLSDERKQMKEIVQECRDKRLVLREADKEGKMVLLTEEDENRLVDEAFKKNFDEMDSDTHGIDKIKEDILEIVSKMPESDKKDSLYNRIRKNKSKFLRAFWKVKTHKQVPSLRIITDEADSFQNVLSFLIKKRVAIHCKRGSF